MKMLSVVISIPLRIYQGFLNFIISIVAELLLLLIFPGLRKKYNSWKLSVINFLCTGCFPAETPWILNGIHSYFIDIGNEFSTGFVDIFFVEYKLYITILPLELDVIFEPLRPYLIFTGKYHKLRKLQETRERQLSELDTPVAHVTLMYSEALDFSVVKQQILSTPHKN